MTKQYTGDLLGCGWGCPGRGSCVPACPMGAISMGSRGAAEVDRNKCIGCGLCVKTCSKGLIRLTTAECSVSTAIRMPDIIWLEKIHAVIDSERCVSCGVCPVGCSKEMMNDTGGILYN